MLDEMRLKRNARTVTATRMTTPPERSEEKEGKRKEISPVEGKGDTKRKRPTTVEASYAGACAGNSSAKATTDYTNSDVKEDWIPVRGRRGKRTDTPTMVRKANAGRAALDKPKRPEGPKRVRNRPEAILVKVGRDKEWIQVYKDLMGARETLKESCGIRRTRTGDILIELKAGSNARKTAADIKNTALRGKVRALPMRDKTSVEIRDIDPLVGKEELAR